jgi:predicted RND superfamily exporter protein
LVTRIEQLAKRELGNDYELRPTGDFYQVVVDSNRLVSNVVQSFCLSLSMVLMAIYVLFRSFKLLAMALIPNLVPLAWTGGLMGYLHIDLSTGTAMIAAVVIGLTVDSTIHYLARFQREYQGDSKEAVTITTTATGRALSISALVLFLGFSVGGLSSFLPTIYFSLLTGVTMLGALVCDLLILPASLILFGTKEGSTSR